MHADELEIDVSLVRRLLEDSFCSGPTFRSSRWVPRRIV
jgi:hypothetical protein